MTTTNWDKARIGARIQMDGTTTPIPLILPNAITFRTVNNYEVIHDLTKWNNGYFEQPPEYTFTISVPSLSMSSKLLRDIKVQGVQFSLEMYDTENSGEHKLISDTLHHCVLTQGETTVQVGQLVMVVFNGMALGYSYNDGVNLKADVSTTDRYFGDGSNNSPATINNIFGKWLT